jgi:hypothetical protein
MKKRLTPLTPIKEEQPRPVLQRQQALNHDEVQAALVKTEKVPTMTVEQAFATSEISSERGK